LYFVVFYEYVRLYFKLLYAGMLFNNHQSVSKTDN